ncbi:MAG: hypothetical protein WBA12_02530 [Catalinimonas sp.]
MYKRHHRTLTLTALLLLGGLPAGAQSYEERVTTVSNVGMTVSNLGLIGNAFRGSYDVLGFPSLEYPQNSGVEHVFQGGLWVGGLIDGAQVSVTTGALDAAGGYSTGGSGFEFTAPIGSGFEERSTLIDNPNFSPDAVSHQDFVSEFTDSNIVVPGTSIQMQGHTNPLNLGVRFEAYNWNFPFSDFFVILNFRITNVGARPLDSVYVAYWADGVIRNVNRTPPGGTPFFDKGGNNYEDSLYMAYEFDAAGDLGFTESYFALKFLGAEDATGFRHPALDPTFKDHYQTWQFRSTDPLFFTPTSDNEQYIKMTNGLNQRANWATELQPRLNQPSNRSTMLSVGPFRRLEPGESVDIAFAVVLAQKCDDGLPNVENTPEQRCRLRQNASWAQTAYNGEDKNFNGLLDEGEDQDGNGRITRFTLPAPPDLPRLRVEAAENQIDLYWSDNAERSVDPITQEQDFEGYRIYKSQFAFDVQDNIDALQSLEPIASYDLAGNGVGFDNGLAAVRLEEPVTFDGDTVTYRYRYTISNLQSGWQHAVALTAFDRGDEETNLETLETSPLASLRRVFPGTRPNENAEADGPFVYPNPYYAGAAWEGQSPFAEDKRLVFANLPARCVIRVFTTAGDLIDTFEHDQQYSGEDTRWYDVYSDPDRTVFSGGEHSWDLLSANQQILAPGVYLFSVEDRDTGERHRGKFVVIK